MAENKKSFVLYCDLIHTIEKMPDDKAGLLLKHLFRYVNDKNPITEDLLVEIAFEPIKHQLKRDLSKWDTKIDKLTEQGRLGGIKSGEARALKKKQNEAKASKNEANEAVTVTVNVNDTVNVINNIEHRKLKFSDSLKPFLELYGKEMLNSFYLYWTEPNKSGTKFKQELQNTWDSSRRLKTWSTNNFGNKTVKDKSNMSYEERDEFMRNAGKM